MSMVYVQTPPMFLASGKVLIGPFSCTLNFFVSQLRSHVKDLTEILLQYKCRLLNN